MEEEPGIANHKLPVIFEHVTQKGFEGDRIAFNGRHDLIAVVDTEDGNDDVRNVLVYRLNGQLVYTIKSDGAIDVPCAVAWKPDGSLLAVTRLDGDCTIHSGETGKLVNRFAAVGAETVNADPPWKTDLEDDPKPERNAKADEIPDIVSWTLQNAGPRKRAHRSDSHSQQSPSGEWHEDEKSDVLEVGEAGEVLADLTSSITQLDITQVLPKLGCLPSHALRQNNVFNSQAATNSIFDDHESNRGLVNMLVTGNSSGLVKFVLDENLIIGTADLGHRPRFHASHSDVSCHAFVCEVDAGNTDPRSEKGGEEEFGDQQRDHSSTNSGYLVSYIDPPLDTLGGPLLQVVTTNTKRIHSLISYIQHTIRCMIHDFFDGQKVPKRFTSMIEEELSEKQEGDLATNLYHLAMTGSFSPTILEWLTDIIKDTNHKRWDKEMNTMYMNVQEHIFKNLLPALDRITIATIIIRGQAKFWEGSGMCEVDVNLCNEALTSIDHSRLAAERLQLIVMSEHREFRAFSKWLRVMVEIGVAGPGSKTAMEIEEREIGNLDYNLALTYIREALAESKLGICLDSTKLHAQLQTDPESVEHALKLDNIQKFHFDNRNKSDADLRAADTASIKLFSLNIALIHKIRRLTTAIQIWRTKLLPGPTTINLNKHLLMPTNPLIHETQLHPSSSGSSTLHILAGTHTTAAKTRDSFSLLLIHRPAPTATTPNPTSTYDHAEYRLATTTADEPATTDEAPPGILSVRLENPHPTPTALVLYRNADAAHSVALLRCDLQAYKAHRGPHGGRGDAPLDPKLWLTVLHVFSSRGEAFQPKELLLGGREGRRVAVVHDGKAEWRVLDLEAEGELVGGGGEEGLDG